MQIQIKNLPKSLIEITVELSLEEMKPYLEHAAFHLSKNKPIAGFRPGKAPYDMVVKQFGEGPIWEEAAQGVVQKIYNQVVKEKNLETIGSPHIDILKLAPNNPFIFKATVPLLPKIILGDFSKISVECKQTIVEEKSIDKVLDDLRKMQTKEIVSNAPLTESDKVVVDMEITLDKVPIEGGQTKGHSIYMDEKYYLPGLKEKLLGIKRGEKREFKLTFPKTHYSKMLAGKEAEFTVTSIEVYRLEKPSLDDAFAQTLGQKTLLDLRAIIRRNLEEEAKFKDEEKFEIELLEKAREKTKFGDIPEILINEETIKMLHELKSGITRQGMDFAEYLKKIDKTTDQLKLDFAPAALERVKSALVLRQIVKEQKIKVTDDEVEREVEQITAQHKDDSKTQEYIRSAEARTWLENFLLNKKAIQRLKRQFQGQPPNGDCP